VLIRVHSWFKSHEIYDNWRRWRVGSCAAFALQCAGLVAEIQFLMQQRHGRWGGPTCFMAALLRQSKIYAGDYGRLRTVTCFYHCWSPAKARRVTPDLINRNVSLFVQILDSMSLPTAKRRPVFVVSTRWTFSRTRVQGSGFHGTSLMVSARCWTHHGSARSLRMNCSSLVTSQSITWRAWGFDGAIWSSAR